MLVGKPDIACVAAAALLSQLATGCNPEITCFNVIDYRQSGLTNEYHQAFDECYYRFDAANNLELVARQRTFSDDGSQNTQVVHLQTFWRVRPGRTSAEQSMINATVSYMIVTPPTGAGFEGSGFLCYDENRDENRIQGRLERSTLTPYRRLGDADRLFDRAELTGPFFAERNEAMVVQILNDMQRIFGPPPDRTPPPTDPDLW